MDMNWLEELEMYSDPDTTNDLEIEMISRALEKAENVTVLTGAGISVESGIPDFRSSNGLWKKYDPATYGSYENFKTDPKPFWKMAEELHKIKAYPNCVHQCLAELQKLNVVKTIVTQNVDGLHQQAGSKHVLEIHGNGDLCHCVNCDFIEKSEKQIWNKKTSPQNDPPKCPKCGALMKLDVVLFGEKLDRKIYDEVVASTTKTDFLLVLGTSLQVAPCNIIPFRAKHCGAQVAFINCTKTPMDEYADFVIRGDLNQIVPRITERVKKIKEARDTVVRKAFFYSYSIAFVIMTMIVSFYNNVFHADVKVDSFIKPFDTERCGTPTLCEIEPMRRHSVPLDVTE